MPKKTRRRTTIDTRISFSHNELIKALERGTVFTEHVLDVIQRTVLVLAENHLENRDEHHELFRELHALDGRLTYIVKTGAVIEQMTHALALNGRPVCEGYKDRAFLDGNGFTGSNNEYPTCENCLELLEEGTITVTRDTDLLMSALEQKGMLADALKKGDE